MPGQRRLPGSDVARATQARTRAGSKPDAHYTPRARPERTHTSAPPPVPPDAPQDNGAPGTSAARAKADRAVTDLKELSGGERSYTNVSFMLALGEYVEAPFRCMDEYDVVRAGGRRLGRGGGRPSAQLLSRPRGGLWGGCR